MAENPFISVTGLFCLLDTDPGDPLHDQQHDRRRWQPLLYWTGHQHDAISTGDRATWAARSAAAAWLIFYWHMTRRADTLKNTMNKINKMNE